LIRNHYNNAIENINIYFLRCDPFRYFRYHVHSIYRISPTDYPQCLCVCLRYPPWNDAYDWFEEKFGYDLEGEVNKLD